MMVIERFYFSAGGHIKAIFLKKTLAKSIKIDSHDFIRKANGYEMWKKLRADPDWKALGR